MSDLPRGGGVNVQRWLVRGAQAALVAFIPLACAVALTTGAGLGDESWFLRVLQRVNSGEVLYRDVAYPVLPVAVYVGSLITAVFGTTFLVIELMVFAAFAAILWTCDAIARELDFGRTARVLLALLLCAWASPAVTDHLPIFYHWVSTVFLLLCFRFVLVWTRRRAEAGGAAWLGAASVAAAVSFATRDQSGIAALAGVLASVAIVLRQAPRRTQLHALAIVLASFVASVLLIIVPIAASGAFAAFVESFVVERGAYWPTSSLPYASDMTYRLQHAAQVGTAMYVFEAVRVSVSAVLPGALVALAIAVATARGTQVRTLGAILCSFAAAGFLTAFPRSDIIHLLIASPLVLLGLAYAIDRVPRVHLRNAVCAVLLIWTSLGFAAGLWESFHRLRSVEYAWLELPYFQHAMVHQVQKEALHRNRNALIAAADNRPVLLLTYEAAFYYLVSGVRNPTPFDYPMVAAFGRNGEEKLIADITSQQIPVCLSPYREAALRPAKLETFVTQEMQFVGNLGFCNLYGPKSTQLAGRLTDADGTPRITQAVAAATPR